MNNESRNAGIIKLSVWSSVALILIILFVGALISGSTISLGSFISFEGYVYDDADSYAVGNAEYAENIEAVDISWISGKINIVTWDGDTVKIEEVGDIDGDDDIMRSRVNNGTLSVKFAKSGVRMFADDIAEKELTVYIPASMSASVKRLKIRCAAADLTVDGGQNPFSFDKIDVDSASGEINVKCLRVSVLDVDTASGDVYLEGSFGDIDVDAASADVKIRGSVDKLELGAMSGDVDIDGEIREGEIGAVSSTLKIKTYAALPSRLEVEAVSGNVELILPAIDSGFVARLESMSGDMTCNGERGNYYKTGSGVASYDFESVSGDVIITAQ